ncbi:hypothetical protein AB0M86_47620 [Streptomyces sp. NPDC051639]|uniref:hypothetical protein n=1 Tax=Streptomyces sp. NPDC051639 TaxID=3155671 RepID=UPI0034127FA6
MIDDFSGPTRRPTRRSYAELESEHFVRELEEGGAFVSSGRSMPWRGLEGHDPLDDESPEDIGERAYEQWHDGMYDEDDPERPQRQHPRGRAFDITPPAVGEVVVRVDPAIAAAYAARQAEATPGATWEVDGGTVTVVGALKIWRGACAQCSTEFEQKRPGDQKRRWRKTCSKVCAAGWERDRARDRKRRQRGDEAA